MEFLQWIAKEDGDFVLDGDVDPPSERETYMRWAVRLITLSAVSVSFATVGHLSTC